jgi:hypothetical protein
MGTYSIENDTLSLYYGSDTTFFNERLLIDSVPNADPDSISIDITLTIQGAYPSVTSKAFIDNKENLFEPDVKLGKLFIDTNHIVINIPSTVKFFDLILDSYDFDKIIIPLTNSKDYKIVSNTVSNYLRYITYDTIQYKIYPEIDSSYSGHRYATPNNDTIGLINIKHLSK